jgi:hypothetical protein
LSAEALPCRQALALALDVSGSVDAREYRLQLDGIVEALRGDAVQKALLAQPGAPVDLMVFEWSGPQDIHVLVDWKTIRGAADIAIIQETLLQVRRREAATPGTALGQAMASAFDTLQTRAECWARTLDISGDGKSNLGPEPKGMRAMFDDAGITVNALVIGADAPGFGDLRQEDIAELSSYFRTHVITGPDSFVQTAIGYEQYAAAMARKLERELKPITLSHLFPHAFRPAGIPPQ